MIHHVQLGAPADSESAARAFWVDVIDLEEIPKPPSLVTRGGCWFRGHGIEIHIGIEDDFRAARKAHPGLLVADLDTWAQRLIAAGFDVTWDEEFPGMRRFYSADPFANRLEFLEHVEP